MHFAFQLTGMILLGGLVLQSLVMVVLEALDYIFLVALEDSGAGALVI